MQLSSLSAIICIGLGSCVTELGRWPCTCTARQPVSTLLLFFLASPMAATRASASTTFLR